MEQVAFDVPAMCSRECERAVTSALINVPGVQWASASPAGVVGAQFDPCTTDPEELREAVLAAGFETAP